MQEKYGIVDIGSNTMRLVIYRHEKIGRLKEIENIKAVARLRNYVDENQHLTGEGISILVNTLRHFEEIVTHYQVSNVKVVATATIRNAKNKHEIIDEIHKNSSLNIRILSEYEEAFYGFLAVINSTSITEGITIDIGGGSTEITYFKDRKLIHYHSFPFGALSLKKQFITADTPSEFELMQLTAYLNKEMNSLDWIKDKKLPVIGIGGSARNVAQIDQARKVYPLGGLHQYEMNVDDLTNIKEMVTSLPYEQMKRLEGLSEDRADIMIPAIEVFRVLCDTSNATSFILSRKGLRDGVFFEELFKPLKIKMFPNVIEESMYELTYEYEININHCLQVAKVVLFIFDSLRQKGFSCLTENHRLEVKRAAFLFQLGNYIDAEASSQHTFYLLANRTIDGLMHKERLRLAAIASYKSKSTLKQYLEPFQNWFTKDEIKVIRILGAALRFAYALNETKRNIIDHIEITEQEESLLFDIFCSKNEQAEKYQAEKQKKHLEKALKKKIVLHFSKIDIDNSYNKT